MGFILRSEANKNSKQRTLLTKYNYSLYFREADWYKTCDEKYVHESVINEVDSNFCKNKLGKYE